MEKYSTTTEMQFIARFTRMAFSVEMPSTTPMKKGPNSLHTRSIRLICEFMAALACVSIQPTWQQSDLHLSAATLSPATTTTQSLSTETRFMMAASFSTQASATSRARRPERNAS